MRLDKEVGTLNREVAEIIERATKEEIIKMSNNKVVSQVDINSNNKSDSQIKAIYSKCCSI